MQTEKNNGIEGAMTAGELIDKLWGNGAQGAKRRGAMTFWDYCDSFPPILCRLLARHRYGRPLTTEEIVRYSGVLSHAMVEAISESTSWRDVRLGDMRAFLKGCNLDFCDTTTMRRTFDWLRKTTLNSYLQKIETIDTRYFYACYLPLFKRWYKSYGIVTKDSPIREPVRSLLIRLKPLLENSDKPYEVPNITAAPEFP